MSSLSTLSINSEEFRDEEEFAQSMHALRENLNNLEDNLYVLLQEEDDSKPDEVRELLRGEENHKLLKRNV